MILANVISTAINTLADVSVLRTRQFAVCSHQHLHYSGNVDFSIFAMRENYYGKDNFKACN